MKRQHTISNDSGGGETNIPYPENLVHFAPFTTYGDTSDHITGDVISVDSGNTFTWDATNNCYKWIYGGSGGSYSGIRFPNCLYANEWNSDKTQNVMTIMLDIKVDEYYGNQCPVGIYNGGPWITDLRYVSAGSWHRVIGIKPIGSYSTIYLDSTVIVSQQGATGTNTQYSTGLYVMSHPGWNNISNVPIYCKNFIIWNRALTLQEVLAVNPGSSEPVVVIPTAPQNVSATGSSSTATITWNSVETATSYKIYRCATQSGTYTQIGTSQTNSYTDNSAQEGDNYYKVKASNSAGDSEFSSYAYYEYSGGGGGGVLPAGYTELAYIQSTGTQYINLGFSPATKSKYSYTIDCQFTEMKSYKQHAFGNDTCDLNYSSSGYIALNNVSTYLGLDRHTVKIAVTFQSGSSYNKVYWVDDVQKTSYSATWFATNEPICVFATKPFWSSSSGKGYLKVYSCSVESAGTVIRECYPAMRNSDSAIGLYDVINNTFYINNGSGTFLYAYKS